MVINSFRSYDINPTFIVPVIARQFEIAVLLRKYTNSKAGRQKKSSNLIWTTKLALSNLSGNFTTEMDTFKVELTKNECKISIFYTALTIGRDDCRYCVGLNLARFLSSSKPWNVKFRLM